ncbi:hypothetical protein BCR39DRAFT_514841 [Naematelia encephala]|uniref:Uncharacterized protein n=1 Tax=Naematelia encephala TaxID=71784 RepID=A0A1Y2BJ35_9TREE|nr:hypothetical protein BCR39DRAFT_514841 [Naematelia encephala]
MSSSHFSDTESDGDIRSGPSPPSLYDPDSSSKFDGRDVLMIRDPAEVASVTSDDTEANETSTSRRSEPPMNPLKSVTQMSNTVRRGTQIEESTAPTQPNRTPTRRGRPRKNATSTNVPTTSGERSTRTTSTTLARRPRPSMRRSGLSTTPQGVTTTPQQRRSARIASTMTNLPRITQKSTKRRKDDTDDDEGWEEDVDNEEDHSSESEEETRCGPPKPTGIPLVSASGPKPPTFRPSSCSNLQHRRAMETKMLILPDAMLNGLDPKRQLAKYPNVSVERLNLDDQDSSIARSRSGIVSSSPGWLLKLDNNSPSNGFSVRMKYDHSRFPFCHEVLSVKPAKQTPSALLCSTEQCFQIACRYKGQPPGLPQTPRCGDCVTSKSNQISKRHRIISQLTKDKVSRSRWITERVEAYGVLADKIQEVEVRHMAVSSNITFTFHDPRWLPKYQNVGEPIFIPDIYSENARFNEDIIRSESEMRQYRCESLDGFTVFQCSVLGSWYSASKDARIRHPKGRFTITSSKNPQISEITFSSNPKQTIAFRCEFEGCESLGTNSYRSGGHDTRPQCAAHQTVEYGRRNLRAEQRRQARQTPKESATKTSKRQRR